MTTPNHNHHPTNNNHNNSGYLSLNRSFGTELTNSQPRHNNKPLTTGPRASPPPPVASTSSSSSLPPPPPATVSLQPSFAFHQPLATTTTATTSRSNNSSSSGQVVEAPPSTMMVTVPSTSTSSSIRIHVDTPHPNVSRGWRAASSTTQSAFESTRHVAAGSKSSDPTNLPLLPAHRTGSAAPLVAPFSLLHFSSSFSSSQPTATSTTLLPPLSFDAAPQQHPLPQQTAPLFLFSATSSSAAVPSLSSSSSAALRVSRCITYSSDSSSGSSHGSCHAATPPPTAASPGLAAAEDETPQPPPPPQELNKNKATPIAASLLLLLPTVAAEKELEVTSCTGNPALMEEDKEEEGTVPPRHAQLLLPLRDQQNIPPHPDVSFESGTRCCSSEREAVVDQRPLLQQQQQHPSSREVVAFSGHDEKSDILTVQSTERDDDDDRPFKRPRTEPGPSSFSSSSPSFPAAAAAAASLFAPKVVVGSFSELAAVTMHGDNPSQCSSSSSSQPLADAAAGVLPPMRSPLTLPLAATPPLTSPYHAHCQAAASVTARENDGPDAVAVPAPIAEPKANEETTNASPLQSTTIQNVANGRSSIKEQEEEEEEEEGSDGEIEIATDPSLWPPPISNDPTTTTTQQQQQLPRDALLEDPEHLRLAAEQWFASHRRLEDLQRWLKEPLRFSDSDSNNNNIINKPNHGRYHSISNNEDDDRQGSARFADVPPCVPDTPLMMAEELEDMFRIEPF